MKLWNLLNKKGKKMEVTIDESAKEEFCKMMDWDEETFEKYTVQIS